MRLDKFVQKIVASDEGLSPEEVSEIAREASLDELLEASEAVTNACVSRKFDSCSIINAKSGRCGEDCHWCAQSRHYHTGAAEYPLLGKDEIVATALKCRAQGIGRFSFVTSGLRLSDAEVDSLCEAAREISSKSDISLCTSAGLLSKAQLQRLFDAGVRRYHCNLETAPSFFSSLCTTHFQEQKIDTLRFAAEVGMDVCSGGIIGMGETEGQRIELALKLRELGVTSIPINVLNPIAGTPLENIPLLSDEDLLRTVALFRLILPKAWLRLAGGMARFSKEAMVRVYKAGANAAIMGDMLTTSGEDIQLNISHIRDAGYEF